VFNIHTERIMEKTYFTSDIVKGLEIAKERLREWIILNYVKASIPSPGPGQAAEFTLWDVYQIQAFRVMIEGGLSRETASTFLGAMRDNEDLPKDEVLIFRRSGDHLSVMSAVEGSEWVLDLRNGFAGLVAFYPSFQKGFPKTPKDWDDLYVINFGKIRRDVDLRME